MKKFLINILIFASLFLTSCGYLSSTFESNSEPSLATDIAYPYQSDIVDTPTRVIYPINGQIRYYNKLDGQEYVFCFDPLCDHDLDCLSYKFPYLTFNTSVAWCGENNRIYFLRGSQFCSVSFDGSDLKIEKSYGEHGYFDQYVYETHLWNISCYNNIICFLIRDNMSGEFRLIEYDVRTKSYIDLNDYLSLAGVLEGYILSDRGIYMRVIFDDETRLCFVPYNGQNLEFVSNLSVSLTDGIFDNQVLYLTMYIQKDESKYRTIVSYSVNDKQIKEEYSHTDANSAIVLLASTDKYLYFKQNELKIIGYKNTSMGLSPVVNTYSKLYRMNMDSKEIECIFNDLSCEISNMCFLDSFHLLIVGDKCVPDDMNAKKIPQAFTAELDENGYIINLLEVS